MLVPVHEACTHPGTLNNTSVGRLHQPAGPGATICVCTRGMLAACSEWGLLKTPISNHTLACMEQLPHRQQIVWLVPSQSNANNLVGVASCTVFHRAALGGCSHCTCHVWASAGKAQSWRQGRCIGHSVIGRWGNGCEKRQGLQQQQQQQDPWRQQLRCQHM
jgi:hypothetical protein